MIIGRGGKSIRKIMEDYKVDIRLPRDGDEDPTRVVVSGDQVRGNICLKNCFLKPNLVWQYIFLVLTNDSESG